MSEDTTYNGWKNYPTWCVNLWLSNDEGLYREAQERTEQTRIDIGSRLEPGEERTRTTRYTLANNFKDWVVDDLAPDLGATFTADLLGYALGEVDWDEIADAWLENA